MRRTCIPLEYLLHGHLLQGWLLCPFQPLARAVAQRQSLVQMIERHRLVLDDWQRLQPKLLYMRFGYT